MVPDSLLDQSVNYSPPRMPKSAWLWKVQKMACWAQKARLTDSVALAGFIYTSYADCQSHIWSCLQLLLQGQLRLKGWSHKGCSLALFSQGVLAVSCFLLAGAKSTDRVWLLISNYERNRWKKIQVGVFPRFEIHSCKKPKSSLCHLSGNLWMNFHLRVYL